MYLELFIFAAIGYIPYVTLYFALDVKSVNVKRLWVGLSFYFGIWSVVKLFIDALVLPEVNGWNLQTAIVTMCIHSLEIFPIRMLVSDIRLKGHKKYQVVAFWWSALSAVISSILTFISNSRNYELEPVHILKPFSTISYAFTTFSLFSIVESMPLTRKAASFSTKNLVLLLLTALPYALGSIEPNNQIPQWIPLAAQVSTSALAWLVVDSSVQKH